MDSQKLYHQIITRKSFLLVGLDTDPSKLPSHLKGLPEGTLEFNKQIIDATQEFCVGYKINTAFYESEGLSGWECMQKTLEYIPNDHFVIADAKRGDIGNTSVRYARAFFEQMNFDALTVAPYMGEDSVSPFYTYAGKWVIILGLTSNSGSKDFQMNKLESGVKLFEQVLTLASGWGSRENTMFVVGATQPQMLTRIREIIPHHFLLVPGVGAQGGSLEQVVRFGMNAQCGLLINSSRGIIYASDGRDFAEAAAAKAKNLQEKMEDALKAYGHLV